MWLTWWLGDLAGDLVVAPVVLLWCTPGAARSMRRKPLETLLLLLVLVGVGLAVFGGAGPLPSPTYPLAFLAIPALVWASFRFGPIGAASAMLVSFALAVFGTLRGAGPFAVGSANESLLILQAFMIVMASTVLPMAALVWDRQDVERERASLLTRAQEAQVEAEERGRVAEEFASIARSPRRWTWMPSAAAWWRQCSVSSPPAPPACACSPPTARWSASPSAAP